MSSLEIFNRNGIRVNWNKTEMNNPTGLGYYTVHEEGKPTRRYNDQAKAIAAAKRKIYRAAAVMTPGYFMQDFAPFVCEGDSISCEVNGVTYTARLVRDYNTDPHEYDAPGWCFDTAGDAAHSRAVKRNVERNRRLLAAWDRDEWHYFGVVIDAEQDGWRKENLASLWGIEGNFPSRAKNPNRYFRDVTNELMPQAIDQVDADADRRRNAYTSLADELEADGLGEHADILRTAATRVR